MKSAIINVVVVPTMSVLSAADKSKVRTIVSAGLNLPVNITRSDFEAIYDNAKDMTPTIHDFIHVRVNRNKKLEGFSIVEDDNVIDSNDVAEENNSDYFDSLIDEAIGAPVAEDNASDDIDIPFAFSDEELNNINMALDDSNVPVAEAEPVKEETEHMTALEKAINDMMNSYSDNELYDYSAYDPDHIPDEDKMTEEEVEAAWEAYDNFVPEEETAQAVIDEEAIETVNNNDVDREFVKFVHDKAVAGKYPRWTQNIDKRNLNEYATMIGKSIEDIVEKYLMANKNKHGYITYYSVRPEFIARYYEQACYTSSDYKWFVVVKGNNVELYEKKGNEHVFNKTVNATESPDAYTKALKVLESYMFRKGVWAE